MSVWRGHVSVISRLSLASPLETLSSLSQESISLCRDALSRRSLFLNVVGATHLLRVFCSVFFLACLFFRVFVFASFSLFLCLCVWSQEVVLGAEQDSSCRCCCCCCCCSLSQGGAFRTQARFSSSFSLFSEKRIAARQLVFNPAASFEEERAGGSE